MAIEEENDFISALRDKYRILVQKFKSLNVVFEEHKRNTRDLINNDNAAKVRGVARKRPKTPASVTWLYRSLRDEVCRLREQVNTWKKQAKTSQALQVSAIMMDLENQLRQATEGMEMLKKAKDMSALFEPPKTPELEPSEPEDTTPSPEPPPKDLPEVSKARAPSPPPPPPAPPDPPVRRLPSAMKKSPVKPPSPPPSASQQPPPTKVSFAEPRKVPSPPPPPPTKQVSRLSFRRQDSFFMPRLPSRQKTTLFIPKRQKTMIVTTQSCELARRRNSIPLRRQATFVDRPPMLICREKSQVGYPFNSSFPEITPLPPIRRGNTFANDERVIKKEQLI